MRMVNFPSRSAILKCARRGSQASLGGRLPARPSPAERIPSDRISGDLIDRSAAGKLQGKLHLGLQRVEHRGDARRASEGQAAESRASGRHRARAERQRLKRMDAPPDTTIQEDGNIRADGLDDPRQGDDRRGHRVQLPVAMVGNLGCRGTARRTPWHCRESEPEVTRRKWSTSDVGFSAGFPRLDGEIGHEEAVFGGADRDCAEAGGTGLSVVDLTRKAGISEQTFYRWKKQYAGLRRIRSASSSSLWRRIRG
jgi:hypothetical protein